MDGSTSPENPIQSPEAKAIATEIVGVASGYLADKKEVARQDPEKVKGNLIIVNKNEVAKTIFAGAELGVSRYTFDYLAIGNGAQRTTQELWHFYPDHVQKTTRRNTETYSGQILDRDFEEIEEANAEELQKLLSDLKTSEPLPDYSPVSKLLDNAPPPGNISTPETSRDEGSKGYLETFGVYSNDKIALLQEAAIKTGIALNILAKEGQQYTTLPSVTRVNGYDIEDFDHVPYTGTVEQGESYIMISGTVPLEYGLSDFWNEADRLEEEQSAKKPE